MSANATESKQTTLERLREDFQAKGYQFIIDPRGDQIPDFLRAYKPDAVAIGQRDKVIIEVKRRSLREPKAPLAQLSQEIPSHSGWRYLLVYDGQDPNEIIELSRPEKFQIDQAITEVRTLEQSGHIRAAMIESWSLLEALARRLYTEDIRISLRPLSPIQVVEQLAMDGQISDQTARRLRALGSLRNSLVHGDLNVNISKDDLYYMIQEIETINSHLVH